MGSVKKPSYKYCVVPLCKNNTVRAPNKHFFSVPGNPIARKKWCKAMKRTRLSPNSRFHCCEDHFNLEEDAENYMEYKIMHNIEGKNMFLRLKNGVLPRYFEVQNRRKPPDKNKRKMEPSRTTVTDSNPSSSTTSNVLVDSTIHTSYIMLVPAIDITTEEIDSACEHTAGLMDSVLETSEAGVTNKEPDFTDIKVETQSGDLKLEPEFGDVKLEPEFGDVKLEPEFNDIKLEPEFGDMELEQESVDIKMEQTDDLIDNTLCPLTSAETANHHSVFIRKAPADELTDNAPYTQNSIVEPVVKSNHPQKVDKAVQVNIRAKYRSKGTITKIKDIRRSLFVPLTGTK